MDAVNELIFSWISPSVWWIKYSKFQWQLSHWWIIYQWQKGSHCINVEVEWQSLVNFKKFDAMYSTNQYIWIVLQFFLFLQFKIIFCTHNSITKRFSAFKYYSSNNKSFGPHSLVTNILILLKIACVEKFLLMLTKTETVNFPYHFLCSDLPTWNDTCQWQWY